MDINKINKLNKDSKELLVFSLESIKIGLHPVSECNLVDFLTATLRNIKKVEEEINNETST